MGLFQFAESRLSQQGERLVGVTEDEIVTIDMIDVAVVEVVMTANHREIAQDMVLLCAPNIV